MLGSENKTRAAEQNETKIGQCCYTTLIAIIWMIGIPAAGT